MDSTYTTMVILELDRTDTRQHSFRATSIKLDGIRSPVDLVPTLKESATSSSQETDPSHPLSLLSRVFRSPS